MALSNADDEIGMVAVGVLMQLAPIRVCRVRRTRRHRDDFPQNQMPGYCTTCRQPAQGPLSRQRFRAKIELPRPKIAVTELLAYGKLGPMIENEQISPRTANFASFTANMLANEVLA